ncbi:MAG TPA: hypothetical protein VM290_11160 [Gaiellaceae bacterium]|nr:hypothetical protein [Gaiellaceae bacterium]
MVVGLDDLRPEPSLEDVARDAVALVEELRVAALQPLHPGGEVRLPHQLDHQVEVVRHQAVDVGRPRVVADRAGEEPLEEAVILGVVEDRRTAIPARGDVEERAGELDAERARHRRRP